MLFPDLKAIKLTDVGRVRKENQDSVLTLAGQGVIAVADGVGGGQAGAWASQTVCEEIVSAVGSLSADSARDMELWHKAGTVSAAIHRANQKIYQKHSSKGESSGSTIVALVFCSRCPGFALALHAGDSRLYRFRKGRLRQLTQDHSASELVGAGFKNMITRAVGVREQLKIEITPVRVRAGDLFLLCSDGLSNMLNDAAISSVLAGRDDLMDIGQRLVHDANQAGGKDNISVVLGQVNSVSTAHSARISKEGSSFRRSVFRQWGRRYRCVLASSAGVLILLVALASAVFWNHQSVYREHPVSVLSSGCNDPLTLTLTADDRSFTIAPGESVVVPSGVYDAVFSMPDYEPIREVLDWTRMDEVTVDWPQVNRFQPLPRMQKLLRAEELFSSGRHAEALAELNLGEELESPDHKEKLRSLYRKLKREE
jgi:PPM family protein phosphatase